MKGTELIVMADGGCLRPCDSVSLEILEGLPRNKEILATITQPRNLEQHRKFWALAHAVANFDKEFMDAEQAVDWIKETIPNMHTKKWSLMPDNTVCLVKKLKSISFASMDQVKFGRMYDRALYLWAERIDCDPDVLLAESRGEKLWIERAVEERHGAGEREEAQCQEGQTRNG